MKKSVAGQQQKKCPLCEQRYNIFARACPYCGYNNDQFFNMPEESREAYVEFYHDRGIHLAMEAQAIRENLSTEELYKRAAEFYLDSLIERKL